MTDERTRTLMAWLLGLVAACALPHVAQSGEPAAAPVVTAPADGVEWWRIGAFKLQALWSDTQSRVRGATPEWLHRGPGARTLDGVVADTRTPAYVLLQEDRPDGTELVTVRYRLDDAGAVRAYAGAGLNRSSYFHDDGEVGPALLVRGNRHSAYGAAAEMGAEYVVNERTRLNADLRWVDLDARAEVLRADYGPVAADALLLGLSVGYRFR